MGDPGTSGSWEEMFASHLRKKQAGPLVCPICGQTNSFEPKGTIGGQMADDVARLEFQFGYAACGNCGYSIFFDAAVTRLWFHHIEEGRAPLVAAEAEEGKPTGITREDVKEALMRRATIHFEGRQARVVRLNEKAAIGRPHSALLVLELGDERIELSGYFSSGEFIETSRKPLS